MTWELEIRVPTFCLFVCCVVVSCCLSIIISMYFYLSFFTNCLNLKWLKFHKHVQLPKRITSKWGWRREGGERAGWGVVSGMGDFVKIIRTPPPPPPHLQFIPLKCPSLFRLSQLMTSSKYCEKFVSVFTMRHIAVSLLVFFFTCITSLSCEVAFQPPASLQWPENEHLSLCLRLYHSG